MTSDTGVFGRALDTQGFLSQSPAIGDDLHRSTLRTNTLRRWRRGTAGTHRERCAELAAPWMETARPPQDNATLLRLRVRPFSPGGSQGIVFPGKALFSFVRRVYHCCQEGLRCGSVKGIQGRLNTDVEFLLTQDVLSIASVTRAELHLQLFNPQRLHIRPVLPSMAKRNLPTRYSLWPRGDMVELRVDLLFLFHGLQEAAGGGAGGGPSLVNMRRVGGFSRGGPAPPPAAAPRALQDTDGDVWGDGAPTPPTLELGLALGCSRDGAGVSCAPSGVHLLHTPFVALSYR
ncbi:uncharacterized protein [Centroberyx affinis]|uniref:uncharacterized protein n=1 Tax=Centroberyx affinis TaxID=166261 RepID=UPI003A5B9CC8